MSDTVIEVIRAFIVRTFPLSRGRRLDANDPLLTSGIIDSLGVLSIVGFLEREFGIELLDDDLTPDNFQSLGRLAQLVAGKQETVATGDHGADDPAR